MRKIYTVLALLCLSFFSQAQTVGDYRSNGNVNFNSKNYWQVYTSSRRWSSATTAPASASFSNTNSITVSIGNMLTISSNVSFSSNADFTVVIQGAVNSTRSYTVDYGSGATTVILERAANYSAGSIFTNHRFYNLVLTGTGAVRTFTFSNNLNISNSLTVNSGQLNLPDITATGSTLSINSEGNISFSGAVSWSNLAADFTFTGTGSQLSFGNTLTLSNSALQVNFPASQSSPGKVVMQGPATLGSSSSFNLAGDYATAEFSGSSLILNNSRLGLVGRSQQFSFPGSTTIYFQNGGILDLLASQGILDLGNSTNISGAGNSSYIRLSPTSRVSKAIPANSNFSYPIGTASYYLPLVVSTQASGNTGIFTAGVFTGATIDATPTGSPLEKSAIVDGVWNLTMAGNSTQQASVTLNWQPALEGSVFSTFTDNQIGVSTAIPGATTWKKVSAPARASHSSKNLTTNSLTFSSSQPMAMGIGLVTTTLPLLTRNFTGFPWNNMVKLKWTGVATSMAAHFEVERSSRLNGSFESIASIPVSAVGEKNYFLTDEHPLQPESYYRIKTIDENGYVSYTAIIRVIFTEDQVRLDNLYPSISTGNLTLLISSSRNNQARISIVDMSGKTMGVRQLSLTQGSNNYPLDVHQLPNGQYILVLETQQGRSISRFIRQ